MVSMILDRINRILWSTPLIIVCLAAGLFFTLALRGVQIRKLPAQIRLLTVRGSSQAGLSSFQAFTMALAGRVGTGNIVGVATAIYAGGPGALFWMWVMAILGAATSFVECTLGQLYKEEISGEYRGGVCYYIKNGLGIRWLALLSAVFIIANEVFGAGIQANAITSSVNNAFGINEGLVGGITTVILGILIFGGVKRLSHFSEIVVPFMSVTYIVMALIVLTMKASALPSVFGMIFRSAFGVDAIFGGMLGSAIVWGVKRGVYSNEAGQGTATFSAAAAEVTHPIKQGLVQAFCVYVDTLFVCTATGLMLLVTNSYNVKGSAVAYMEGVEAGAVWTQQAFGSVFPFGKLFVTVALCLFAFTTLTTLYYIAESNFAFFFVGNSFPEWIKVLLRLVYMGAAFLGAVVTTSTAWALADVTIGIVVWINLAVILFLHKKVVVLLRDYEEQEKNSTDQVFDPVRCQIKGADLWKKIR